ncbi:replication initiator protein A, partial [Dysosmobacter welbionis]|uniref:replication initiator protein A n=1 Tax=Dysosmobacter welbionis TaxID=2093857 RepID=UPI003A947026
MRAAKIKEHPSFLLMKQTDVQSIYYMQMPRWLFSDPRYADMNLDAKVTYTFLLNRFQLSRRKGWVNDQGEVFVIFPRLALAEELRICEKRVTAAFRTLAERELIWEKRCGRGDANQIYLAKVEPQDDPAYQCAPFLTEDGADGGSRTADSAVLSEGAPPQEPQDRPLWTGENGGFGTAESAVLEPQDQPSRKKVKRKIE